MQCPNFFQKADLNGKILKSLIQINVSSNNLKGCFLEVHLDYPLDPGKIEIKREIFVLEMKSNYQLKIADFYDVLIGTVKKLVPKCFDKEKDVLHYENLQLYLRLGLKIKKYILC